jgi:DNA-binding LacI/PurR family transcriptional regulator
MDVLTDTGLSFDPSLESYGYFTIDGGERAMTDLADQPVRPTAVFSMSDEMAFGAIRAMRNHGLQPGRDISIVGIDGHEVAELLDLSTVAQPVQDLGRIAAEALLEQLDGRADRQHQVVQRLATQLIVRGSTAPLT